MYIIIGKDMDAVNAGNMQRRSILNHIIQMVIKQGE